MPSQEETLPGKELEEGERATTRSLLEDRGIIKPEQVEDRWPLLDTWRFSDGGTIFLSAPGHRVEPEAGRTEAETYYPASHPAVLSKEEAGAIAQGASPLPPGVRKRLAAWGLSAYAGEGKQ